MGLCKLTVSENVSIFTDGTKGFQSFCQPVTHVAIKEL